MTYIKVLESGVQRKIWRKRYADIVEDYESIFHIEEFLELENACRNLEGKVNNLEQLLGMHGSTCQRKVSAALDSIQNKLNRL